MATRNSNNKLNKLIPAVAYLRKSTKGKRADGRERQEKSISQQKREIEALAKGKYEIVEWFVDEGISGWKRNGKRPEFDRMLASAKGAGWRAIICDDLDRFSRADVVEVWGDLSVLAGAGIEKIHCVSQGQYDLHNGEDIGNILRLTVSVWGGNDFSRKLSRRVALAHRNRAQSGKRAGHAPYGMADDGKGGLKHGDRNHIKVVRWIFDQFAKRKRSMNAIAAELNAKGTPAPRGGKWYVQAIKELLQRRAYRGDFAYGTRQQGRFHTVDGDGEVVKATKDLARWKHNNPAIVKQGAYKPLVDPKVFDAAQKRLASFSLKGSRKPRDNGFALSGILVCGKCGKPMYGCVHREVRKYRCSTNAKSGSGACEYYELKEHDVLPAVLKLLGEQIHELKLQQEFPPDELVEPTKATKARRKQLEKDIAELQKRIELGVDNMLMATEPETRDAMDRRIGEWRKEMVAMRNELDAGEEPRKQRWSKAELKALCEWWDGFYKRTAFVPCDTDNPFSGAGPDDYDPDEVDPHGEGWQPAGIRLSFREINEALHSLGCEVRLWWKTTSVTRGGRTQKRHEFHKGQIRLGQKTQELPVTLHNVPSAGPRNDNPAADRRGIRRGRGSARRLA